MNIPRGARLRQALGATGGTLLAGATKAVATARAARKPLHPRGQVTTGQLQRDGASPPTGVPWLDEPGVDTVLVRLSHALGLPEGLPDFQGLAIRVPTDTGHGDLLFATTGTGRVTRFVLTLSRSPYHRPMTTLLPYRTAAGPLLLRASPISDMSFELSCAHGTGSWRPFGTLQITSEQTEDAMVSFDPLRNTIPGLDNYPFVIALREPSYRTARRDRRKRL